MLRTPIGPSLSADEGLRGGNLVKHQVKGDSVPVETAALPGLAVKT